ncbi:MAG: FAD-binding oxidoreductase [Burkholderiales bacterium]|nr:FAD-binding oxidoreductase [Burkholderiales bacterium]
MTESFDVVIVGGAVIGSAAAFFLAEALPRSARVLVLEADTGYAHCATTRSLASIRHQFSTPENVRMSMFGTEFLRHAGARLEVNGEAPLIGFVEAGYLFLATAAGWATLQCNHAVQRAEGAQVALLGGEALAARFPWLATGDLAGGSLGLAGEGWLDAHGLMHGLQRKARSLGVQVRAGRVEALLREGSRIGAVRLADGSTIGCGTVINAAGTGAAALARTAGIELPVQARKRCVFHFRSPEAAPGCPLVIDPCGLYFRPEGAGFLCGMAPPEDEDPECSDFDVPPGWFEDRLWPLLAQRVPGFEAARPLSSWAGHYDVNVFDHNVILGAHPQIDNLLFANGFSGHGLQQSPAIGRALMELVLHGGFRSLDLGALGWQRVLQNRPLREVNVV